MTVDVALAQSHSSWYGVFTVPCIARKYGAAVSLKTRPGQHTLAQYRAGEAQSNVGRKKVLLSLPRCQCWRGIMCVVASVVAAATPCHCKYTLLSMNQPTGPVHQARLPSSGIRGVAWLVDLLLLLLLLRLVSLTQHSGPMQQVVKR